MNSSTQSQADTSQLVKEGNNLKKRHHGEIPESSIVKKDTTKDLLTVFSDHVTINFKKASGKIQALQGRWCFAGKHNLMRN